MSTTDGSAPAYPLALDHVEQPAYPGLTKREAMAMHICAGICHDYGNVVTARPEGIRHIGELSVKIADALLSELAKEGE